MVMMRLAAVGNASVQELLRDPERRIPSWILRREYRSTYRTNLVSGEEITAGVWPPESFSSDLQTVVPISLEDGIARQLGVGLGDEMTFDVQGVELKTKVISLRKVDWRRLQPNFFVVFPPEVLEQAPTIFVLVTRVSSPQASAAMQREVVAKFSNVSTIDLTLIVNTVQSVLDKVAFVVRFMAGITIASGLLILAATLVSGRFERLRELALFKTIGATRSQALQMLSVEYIAVGVFAALVSGFLAQGSAWALARYLFRFEYQVLWWPGLIALIALPLLTLASGVLASYSWVGQRPLTMLRAET